MGFFLTSGLAFGAVACSSDETTADPPDGVTCANGTKTATDQGSLVSGLEGSAAGSCVVVSSNITSSTPITVKAGVALVGSKGEPHSITVTGGTTEAAITLQDGAQLANIDVLAAPAVGIAVRSPNAKLTDVKVSGAKTAALAVSCVDVAACTAGTISLDNVTLEKSGYGVWARGAHLVLKNGRVGDNGGTSLSGGLGIVASDGAKLEIEGTKIEKNGGTGLLLDGAKTTASLKNATIADNAERGVWAQRLQGTLDAPSLRMEGCEVSKNHIAGVGGVEARGIIIVGGKVDQTLASPVPTDLQTNELIGDGIAILSGSTDVKVENTVVEGNARAAGILDGAEVGIIIVGGIGAKVAAPATGFKFVVQNSSKANVQISDSYTSAVPQPLAISAPKLNVPGVL